MSRRNECPVQAERGPAFLPGRAKIFASYLAKLLTARPSLS